MRHNEQLLVDIAVAYKDGHEYAEAVDPTDIIFLYFSAPRCTGVLRPSYQIHQYTRIRHAVLQKASKASRFQV